MFNEYWFTSAIHFMYLEVFSLFDFRLVIAFSNDNCQRSGSLSTPSSSTQSLQSAKKAGGRSHLHGRRDNIN